MLLFFQANITVWGREWGVGLVRVPTTKMQSRGLERKKVETLSLASF